MEIHQHAILRRACGARGKPAVDGGGAVRGHGWMEAKLDEERTREHRVDLIVFSHKDRESVAGANFVRCLGSFTCAVGVEYIVGRKARGERGGAYRFDQVAGKARFLER